jgi:transglutaminase-like putative cysteine protease
LLFGGLPSFAQESGVSIRVALNHVTHYRYDRLVGLSPQVVRLRPAPHCRTPIVSYSMRVEPAEHFTNWQQDAFANYQARLVFPEKTREFKITVDLVAEMAVYNPFDFFLEPKAPRNSRSSTSLASRPSWRLIWSSVSPRRGLPNSSRVSTARPRLPRIFWWRSTSGCSGRSAI